VENRVFLVFIANATNKNRQGDNKGWGRVHESFFLECLLQPLLETFKLGLEALREGGAELLLVGFNLVGLGEPLGGLDGGELLDSGGVNLEAREVQGAGFGEVANWGLDGDVLVVNPLGDPLEDAGVITKAGPEELAILLPEPVDVEDLGRLEAAGGGLLADGQPVTKVLAHVVAAEGQHGEGVEAEGADLALGGGSHLRGHRGAHEGAVLPVEGLIHEGDVLGAAPAKDDGIDGHALWVLKLG